jgi:DNA-binding transcriptional LysR family regulator
LTAHRCLGLDGGRQSSAAWQFRAGKRRFSVPINLSVISDTYLSLVRAAVAGLGLIYVPQVVIAAELEQGALQAVLPQYCAGIDWGIYAVHAGRSATRSAAAFIDFVRTVLPAIGGVASQPVFLPRAAAIEKDLGVHR